MNRKKQNIVITPLQNRIFILNIFLLLMCVYINLFSAFKDLNWGVRPSGMGGAFVAISDDVNAIMYNPAGVDQIISNEVQFVYSLPYAGLKLYSGEEDMVVLGQQHFAAAFPTKMGSLGVSWLNFLVNPIYSEDVYLLTYSKRVDTMLGTHVQIPRLFFGINFKYLIQKYKLDERTKRIELQSESSPFRKGTENMAFTLDLGVLLHFTDLRIGLCLKNVTQPKIGLAQKEVIPTEVRVGASYQVRSEVLKTLDMILIPTIEFYYRKSDDGSEDFRYILGTDTVINGMYKVRAGVNDREISVGGGLDFLLSEKWKSQVYITVDYALIWSLAITDNFGSHKISFGVKF